MGLLDLFSGSKSIIDIDKTISIKISNKPIKEPFKMKNLETGKEYIFRTEDDVRKWAGDDPNKQKAVPGIIKSMKEYYAALKKHISSKTEKYTFHSVDEMKEWAKGYPDREEMVKQMLKKINSEEAELNRKLGISSNENNAYSLKFINELKKRLKYADLPEHEIIQMAREQNLDSSTTLYILDNDPSIRTYKTGFLGLFGEKMYGLRKNK